MTRKRVIKRDQQLCSEKIRYTTKILSTSTPLLRRWTKLWPLWSSYKTRRGRSGIYDNRENRGTVIFPLIWWMDLLVEEKNGSYLCSSAGFSAFWVVGGSSGSSGLTETAAASARPWEALLLALLLSRNPLRNFFPSFCLDVPCRGAWMSLSATKLWWGFPFWANRMSKTRMQVSRTAPAARVIPTRSLGRCL